MTRLTDHTYWNNKYGNGNQDELQIEGYKNWSNGCIYKSLKPAGLDGKKILEIGAGGSQWLVFLAKQHPSSTFTGLDYAESGCEDLKQLAENANVDIEVFCADLFSPPEHLKDKFDLVLTYGVVEHFDNLDEVVMAVSTYIKPGGKVFSLIPNMSGVLGVVAKYLNREVYEIHNPHNLRNLIDGHEKANLTTLSASYVCPSEFGVLSA